MAGQLEDWYGTMVNEIDIRSRKDRRRLRSSDHVKNNEASTPDMYQVDHKGTVPKAEQGRCAER
ncbi:hypothetical protein RUM43_008968 [Polyplax serrata]|uniref:Uncharacterized protein n=1 Tax=Polyplax serrata TaxID=468196 RepID=A0AAN8S0V5_POLSC